MSTFKENLTDVSELSRKLVEKNEIIEALKADSERLANACQSVVDAWKGAHSKESCSPICRVCECEKALQQHERGLKK